MAVLSDQARVRIWRALMRYWSKWWDWIGVNKEALQAAVNATDVWIDNNAASYNAALPQPARGALTADQKALLLSIVALARVGEVELISRTLGVGVD